MLLQCKGTGWNELSEQMAVVWEVELVVMEQEGQGDKQGRKEPWRQKKRAYKGKGD
jgi:hypothetical protein